MLTATFIRRGSFYHVELHGYNNRTKPYIFERNTIPEANFEEKVIKLLRTYNKLTIRKIDNGASEPCFF